MQYLIFITGAASQDRKQTTTDRLNSTSPQSAEQSGEPSASHKLRRELGLRDLVDVRSSGMYALEIALTTLAANLLGAALYWRGNRIRSRAHS
jgi:hypothetical protein